MTDDPVLHALIDLVQALEAGGGELSIWDKAYVNALKIIRERCEPQLHAEGDK